MSWNKKGWFFRFCIYSAYSKSGHLGSLLAYHGVSNHQTYTRLAHYYFLQWEQFFCSFHLKMEKRRSRVAVICWHLIDRFFFLSFNFLKHFFFAISTHHLDISKKGSVEMMMMMRMMRSIKLYAWWHVKSIRNLYDVEWKGWQISTITIKMKSH